MSWNEWEQLEWWEQFSLIEGLREEGAVQGGEASPQQPQEHASTPAGQQLQGLGLNVRTVKGKADWE